MCGISGAISVSAKKADLQTLVERIAHSQNARGPDALVVEGLPFGAAQAVLGHNRLSIIDLSPEANQPMSISQGDLTVVFNGEIYNYLELRSELEATGVQFRTRSDTEVLLQAYKAWGDDAFERLFGMFAIAILDRTTNRLVLVRDRFGVKPLYYWTDGRTLAFASTTAVIARWAGLAPNLDYVARGLRFKYYEDETAISPHLGLKALEPGCRLNATPQSGALTLDHRRYYDLATRVDEERARQAGMTGKALESRLISLLEDACKIRLRADVPLGVSLSGGVDSTTIAALVAPMHDNVVGYSFGRPENLESEAPLVSLLSQHIRVRPRWVWPQGRAEIEDLFWATMNAQQAPFPHASMMAQFAVFKAARADGIKVLLGGQAGDEAFMGYRKFYLFYAQSILRQRRYKEMPHLGMALAPFILPVLRRASVFWSERGRYAKSGDGMGTRLWLPATAEGESQGMAAGQTPSDRQMLDLTRYSLPTLLRYEDRNSLGNSVESRLPFIDHRVVEFGVALPERLKIAKGYGKWLLRSAIKDRVPDAIRLNRDKRGFDVDQAHWIDSGLGEILRGALSERANLIRDYLPKGADLEQWFSDRELKENPQAFKEAASLIWLAGQT